MSAVGVLERRPVLVAHVEHVDSARGVDVVRDALSGYKKHSGLGLCVQFYGVPFDDPGLSPMFLAALGRYAFMEAGFGALNLCNLPVTSARLDPKGWELGATRYAFVADEILWDDDDHASYLDAVRRYALYGHTGVLPSPGDRYTVAERVDGYKIAHPRTEHVTGDHLVDIVRERLPWSRV